MQNHSKTLSWLRLAYHVTYDVAVPHVLLVGRVATEDGGGLRPIMRKLIGQQLNIVQWRAGPKVQCDPYGAAIYRQYWNYSVVVASMFQCIRYFFEIKAL